MSDQPTRSTTAGRVFLTLRKKALSEGKSTDEFLQLDALEAFVERLSMSERAGNFTLKGGVLLSAYDVRRPTRDVDLSCHALPNAEGLLEGVIGEIGSVSLDDGWAFTTAGAEAIREDAAYSGVRVAMRGSLGRARQEFHVDVSFGDPIVPAPHPVSLERLLGGRVMVMGYPLSMVFAEKLITAQQRGTANTRWRDYVDVFLLSRAHPMQGEVLIDSLAQVASARGTTPRLLSSGIEGYAALARGKWAAWVRRQKLDERVPVMFAEVLEAVVAFADPAMDGSALGCAWDPNGRCWT